MDILEFLQEVASQPPGIIILIIFLTMVLGVFGTIIMLIRAFRQSAGETRRMAEMFGGLQTALVGTNDRLVTITDKNADALDRLGHALVLIHQQNEHITKILIEVPKSVIDARAQTLQAIEPLLDIITALETGQGQIRQTLDTMLDVLNKPTNGELRTMLAEVTQQISACYGLLESSAKNIIDIHQAILHVPETTQ
jgi:hypothetical protein